MEFLSTTEPKFFLENFPGFPVIKFFAEGGMTQRELIDRFFPIWFADCNPNSIQAVMWSRNTLIQRQTAAQASDSYRESMDVTVSKCGNRPQSVLSISPTFVRDARGMVPLEQKNFVRDVMQPDGSIRGSCVGDLTNMFGQEDLRPGDDLHLEISALKREVKAIAVWANFMQKTGRCFPNADLSQLPIAQ